MDEFPGNSKSRKTQPPVEKKKVEKVISGQAVRRKKPLGVRFREVFLTGEDSRNVFEYMMVEHILPGIKDTIFNAATGGLEAKFYGETGSSYHRRRSASPISNGLGLLTNYAAVTRGPAGSMAEPKLSRRARQTHNFGEIVIPTKPEAEIVLETMYEIVSRHDEVSVADFLSAAGFTPDFTDEQWGWTDLQGSRVRRSPGGGYAIDLPQTEPLS